jgi:transmembrane sensor
MAFNQIPTPHEIPDRAQERIAHEAADWFARLQGGRIMADEQKQFQAWLNADPAHRKAYLETEAFWNNPDLRKVLGTFPLSSTHTRTRHYFKRNWLLMPALAASFLLVTVLSQTAITCLNASYCTGEGETRSIHLADGSIVMLASGSAVDVSLQNQARRVKLIQGEAFFDVARNPSLPFVVDSQFSQTRVLGTQFIVRKDQDADTVTVIKGVVSVSQPNGKAAILKVNGQISVNADNSGAITQVSATNASAWMKGHLLFDNASLGKVAAEIGRYRKGAIVVRNNRLKALKVSGRFSITDTNKALDALEQTLPIRIYRLTPWLAVIT